MNENKEENILYLTKFKNSNMQRKEIHYSTIVFSLLLTTKA